MLILKLIMIILFVMFIKTNMNITLVLDQTLVMVCVLASHNESVIHLLVIGQIYIRKVNHS